MLLARHAAAARANHAAQLASRRQRPLQRHLWHPSQHYYTFATTTHVTAAQRRSMWWSCAARAASPPALLPRLQQSQHCGDCCACSSSARPFSSGSGSNPAASSGGRTRGGGGTSSKSSAAPSQWHMMAKPQQAPVAPTHALGAKGSSDAGTAPAAFREDPAWFVRLAPASPPLPWVTRVLFVGGECAAMFAGWLGMSLTQPVLSGMARDFFALASFEGSDALVGHALIHASGMPIALAVYLATQWALKHSFPSVMRVPAAAAPTIDATGSGTSNGSSSSSSSSSFSSRWGGPLLRNLVLLILGSASFLAFREYRLFSHARSDNAGFSQGLHLEFGLDGRRGLQGLVFASPIVAEEVLFRAMVFARLTRVLGSPLPAAAVSAVLFALFHQSLWEDVLSTAPASGFESLEAQSAHRIRRLRGHITSGLVYAGAYWASGGMLLAPVALHFIWNGTFHALVSPYAPLRDVDEPATVLDALEKMHREEALWAHVAALVGPAPSLAPEVSAYLREQWLEPAPGSASAPDTASIAKMLLPQQSLSQLPQLQQQLPPPPMQLSAQGRAMVGWLFDSLAVTTGKREDSEPFLTPESLAFLWSIQPSHYTWFNAALSVLERRVGGRDSAEMQRWSDRLTQRRKAAAAAAAENSAVRQTVLTLPGDGPFNRAPPSSISSRGSAHTVLPPPPPPAAALPVLQLLRPFWIDMQNLSCTVPPSRFRDDAPVLWRQLQGPGSNSNNSSGNNSAQQTQPQTVLQHRRDIRALQRQWFQRYYSDFWLAFYRTNFPPRPSPPASASAAASSIAETAATGGGRCTRARFEALVALQAQVRPLDTTRWMEACRQVLQGEREHPLAGLLRAHDQGRRQGFRGTVPVPDIA